MGGGLAKRGQRRGARPRPHRRRGPGVQPRRRCRRAGGSVPLCRRAGRLRVTRRPALRLQTRAGAGGFFDGRRVWAEASPSWNLSRHLELSGTYQHNRIRFQGRDQRLVTHLARVRARAALDSRLTGSAFIQYNSVQDALAANVRVRYHARDGTDLWLVYNHGLTADRGLVERSAPATTSRAVVVKYSHTLSF